MKEFSSIETLFQSLSGVVELHSEGLRVLDPKALRESQVESWLFQTLFNSNEDVVRVCRYLIRESALALGIFPSSIQSVYDAMGRGELQGFTTPAINIRGLTYEIVRTILQAAARKQAFPVIFEIARSEIGYTFQRPAEYATTVLAAAIREGYEGPIYIQGDHFQANLKKFQQDPEKEIQAIRDLTREALEYGFFNIDIDTSTLVDLSHATLDEQQRVNYERCAELTKFIRDHEPKGVTVSVGGEIGEVGEKNSTVEELTAYMDGYRRALANLDPKARGMSKVSVQTGTSHGGIPMADGSVAKVKLDFETLQRLSDVSRDQYGLSGAVQHGASTLPDELFDKFPQVRASEIHLATGFQNMILDHPRFPADLKREIYAWLEQNCADEKKAGQTDEQFYYKTRKKGFGPFKRQLWDLAPETKEAMLKDLRGKFEFLFDKLGVSGRRAEVLKFATTTAVSLPVPEGLLQNSEAVATGG